MNDPYKDLDFDLNYRERKRAKALARDWAKRAMEERKREALERDRAESAEVGRIILLYGIVLPACVLGLLWLVGAI